MNISYKIPESKKDITIKQYIEISKLYKQADENEMQITENQIIAICLGIDVWFVSQLPIEDYKLASDNIAKALKEESIMPLTFNLNGVRYGFIPDMENITIGEYSALDGLMKNADENVNEILNVLYRPITKEILYPRQRSRFVSWFNNGVAEDKYCKDKQGKYLVERYDSGKHNTDFSESPCNIYESSLLFFYTLGKQLLSATVKYTREELETNEARILEESGVGITLLKSTLLQNELELRTSTKKLQIVYCMP